MNLGTLVLAVGSGGWMTCWAVYFTRSVGLSPTVFAFGVTVGGLGSVLLVTCVVALAQRSAPGIRIAVLTALADKGKPLDAISSGQVVAHAGFLAIAALCGVLALVWGVADVGVPLWVTTHTAAPPTVLGALIAVNAAAILLFQRRAARAATSVTRSTRLTAVSAVALAASCVLFAATRGGSGVSVVVLLLVACVVQIVGELLFTAGGWGISTGLTPREAHAEYQSVFTASSAAAVLLAPALLALLLVDWGVAGWFALGFVFLAAGLPTPAVGRWALRTPGRTEPPVTVS